MDNSCYKKEDLQKKCNSCKAKKSGSAKIRAKFETLRREIKADIRKQHDLYVNNLVGVVKANPKDFCRYINSQKKDAQGIPPLKKRNGGGVAQSESEKAAEFNGQFTDVFTKSEYSQVPLLDRSAPFMEDIGGFRNSLCDVIFAHAQIAGRQYNGQHNGQAYGIHVKM